MVDCIARLNTRAYVLLRFLLDPMHCLETPRGLCAFCCRSNIYLSCKAICLELIAETVVDAAVAVTEL